MRLDVSHVTGTVLGTACSLLFWASLTQGLHHIDVFHQKTMEVAVGQNVDLPCIVQNHTSLNIVQIEWNKKNGTKLALYSPVHGEHLFQPNVSIQVQRTQTDGLDRLDGSYLRLHDVGKQDSGVYVCDLSTFPLGSIRRHTQLKVKDLNTPPAPPRVTDTRTASPGTEGPQPAVEGMLTTKMAANVTADGFMVTASDGNPNTSLDGSSPSSSDPGSETVPDLSTTPVHPDRPRNPADEAVTVSWVSITHSRVTTASTPPPSVSYDPSTVRLRSSPRVTRGQTTERYGGPVSRSTQDTTTGETESMDTEESSSTVTEESSTLKTTVRRPEKPTTPSPPGHDEENGVVTVEDTGHSLWWIIFPLLVLILLAGILYQRRAVHRRMELPPPFKPPPPPVKYTSVCPHRTVLTAAGPHGPWTDV